MNLERSGWAAGLVAGALLAPGACGPHVVEVGDLPQAGEGGDGSLVGESGSGGRRPVGGGGSGGASAGSPQPSAGAPAVGEGGDSGLGGTPSLSGGAAGRGEVVCGGSPGASDPDGNWPACEFTWLAREDDGDPGAERCTRRPGENTSFMCPVGVGVSATAEIGPAGGVVSLSGTASTLGVAVQLRIPPNALSESVEITITETTVPPPSGFGDWSPLYYFSSSAPVDFRFPAELRMPWFNTSGVVDPALSIHWSSEPDSCELLPLADNYLNAGFNQGSVSFLGWGMVGAALAPECP